MVVVDRLSKYAHFAPLPTKYDAWRVANVFVDTVVKHHGFPSKLVSNRDSVFLNEVWENMLSLSGTKLHFTTAYHPQSDGQMEVRNRGLEQYLRSFVTDRPNKWVNFLPWAELVLNCFYHEGLQTSPFRALYGRETPPLIAAQPVSTCPALVADIIRQRGELLVELRKNLTKPQQRMPDGANKHRCHVEFNVGDRVLLKLQLYRQHSVAKPISQKLGRCFYGLFEVVERIGPVAYRLSLPEGSRIHEVFHVSLLRPFVDGGVSVESEFPSFFARGRVMSWPTKWVGRRTVWRNGVAVEEGLLQWDDDHGLHPSWEPIEVISRRFPTLVLEDKDISNGGGVDTSIPPNEGDVESTLEDGQPAHVVCDTREQLHENEGEGSRSGRPKRRAREPKRLEGFVRYR